MFDHVRPRGDDLLRDAGQYTHPHKAVRMIDKNFHQTEITLAQFKYLRRLFTFQTKWYKYSNYGTNETYLTYSEYHSIGWLATEGPWCRHQMETFSALLALCVGNAPVTGGLPPQRPVVRSFDVLFELLLNTHLSEQSRRR